MGGEGEGSVAEAAAVAALQARLDALGHTALLRALENEQRGAGEEGEAVARAVLGY